MKLVEELRKRPFKPFRIQMTDGVSCLIEHPELVMVGRSTALIGTPAEGYTGIYSRYDTISLLRIVRLQPVEPATEQAAG